MHYRQQNVKLYANMQSTYICSLNNQQNAITMQEKDQTENCGRNGRCIKQTLVEPPF